MPLYEWVKRLGQQHWSIAGSSVTMCGMPMLGNNYAKHLGNNNKKPCKDCQEQIQRNKGEDEHGDKGTVAS